MMLGRRLKASLTAALALMVLAGCGASPTPLARPVSGAAVGVRSTTKAPATKAPMPQAQAQANADEQDIGKNPFVVWVKQNHPQTAAGIINQYLSSSAAPNADPGSEGQRVLLRRQAIETVTAELLKNLKQGLPKGLEAKVAEPGHVRVFGYQRQLGFKINLQFDFTVQMDKDGMIWIRTPEALVKANAESALVRLFGGDLNRKAYEELIKEVDKQGPPNARKTPGLTYTKGGIFRIDPGFAFVNMPS